MSNDNVAKISIIEGDSIEIVKGQHTEYVGKMTYSSSKKLIATAENGKRFGDNPEDPPKSEGRIIDIVMFVAGTTDPINSDGKKHQANTDYWQSSKENFWHKIKDLKDQFLDLHIEGRFFSWSGDNDTKERNIASERLLELILRVYPGWKNQEVHLHLIGHSHGGNVINQFTELVASKEMITKSKFLKSRKVTEFPKSWKVKSITYLSTPFFQKKHQLNHGKLHKNCKIINVHNEYDLTQRLIADFSLLNMEVFLKNFQIDNFKKGLDTLHSVDTSAFSKLFKPIVRDKTDGPEIWRATTIAMSGINQLTAQFIKYIESLPLNSSSIIEEKTNFLKLLKRFQNWTYDECKLFYQNSSTRKGGYGRSEFMEDLNINTALGMLNELFDIKTGVKDSYILKLLAKMFSENSGITDSIEANSWTPKDQAKGLSIKDINITTKDPYHTRNKKNNCENFIVGAAKSVQNKNLEEVLMRLFSQFVKPFVMTIIYQVLDKSEYILSGDLDTQITRLRKSIGKYRDLVVAYNADLVTKDDVKNIKDIMKRPGSVPYLAMNSHSLSHTQFWPEVEKELKNAFSSGKSRKYKEN